MTSTRMPGRTQRRGRWAVVALLAGGGIALTASPAQAEVPGVPAGYAALVPAIPDLASEGIPLPSFAAPAPAPAPEPAPESPPPAEEPAPEDKPTPTSSPYSMWDPDVRPVIKEIVETFDVPTVYTRPDHSPSQERAADFMVYEDKAKGDAVAQYVIDNASRFRVEYLIWQQQIYIISNGYWEPMEDRGSPTANHMDHVHVAWLPAE
jgi:hypothetical protein